MTELRWQRGEVQAHIVNAAGSPLRPLEAKAAVITVPQEAVLKARAMRFLPDLPEKHKSLEQLEVGQVFKMVLQFRESFWEESKFIAEHIGISRRGIDDVLQSCSTHDWRLSVHLHRDGGSGRFKGTRCAGPGDLVFCW